MTALPTVELLGRTVECEAVDGLIEATRDGTGGSLVLCGDPGIGKSALLDYAARSATGLRVERVAGAEAETVLGYGGVHQLVGSMLEDVEALPEPQRRALQLGFGLAVNGEPEPFLLDLGVLGLLERAAADQALLCLVDDVHWLDGASGGTFAFVARRLHQVGLAFVFATEPPESSTPLEGLPLLRVAALDDNHARTMLGRAVAGSLDPVVRARLVLEAAGNPLALQQLVAGLTPAQLDGGESLPDRLSTGEGVEHSVVRRIRRLPLDTQQLLLLLAAEPSGDEALLARAAAELGVGPEAVGPAEAAELLQVGRLALRQVFVGSALYAAAPVEARRRVHAALADACDPELDSDRRAWHRAATIVWPDGELAEELERSAPRALARGGHPAAAALLERAARLTPDRNERVERTFEAVRHDIAAGATQKASALLAEVTPEAADELHRLLALQLHDEIALEHGRGASAPAHLLATARALEPLDLRLARDTYVEALVGTLYAGPLVSDELAREVAAAALSAPRPADAPTTRDLLLDGFAALLATGTAAAGPALRGAIERLRSDDDQELRTFAYGCHAALQLWDEEAGRALADRRLELARESGALAELPRALAYSAVWEVPVGRLDLANARLREAREATRATRNPGVIERATAGRVLVAAWRGKERELRSLAADLETRAAALGHGTDLVLVAAALAVLENGLGHYSAALAASQEALRRETIWATPTTPELIEAAARSDEEAVAAPALARLEASVRAGGTEWGLGMLARSQALLAPEREAEELYRAAIDHLDRSRARIHLARARLVYGEWLRRMRRRREAREQLSRAREMLEAMGARAFAERARAELAATGGRRAAPASERERLLTPHEARIARLAADGLSNAEIADRQFVSPRTVEYHLHKIFRKLGIASRTQLAQKLVELDRG